MSNITATYHSNYNGLDLSDGIIEVGESDPHMAAEGEIILSLSNPFRGCSTSLHNLLVGVLSS